MKSFGEQNIKKPNVAGQFYPSDIKELTSLMDQFLLKAAVEPYKNQINIIVSPHAGYIYSAPVAAYGFKAASKGNYRTVIILAPSHFFGFDTISVGNFDGFETPLGTAAVDKELTDQILSADPHFVFEPKAFEREHALEVEIPFIQKLFPDAKIVPLIFGQTPIKTIDHFARSLAEILKDRQDVLIVVSTDMSHYHPRDAAYKMDRDSIAAIKSFNIERVWDGNIAGEIELCGFIPMTAALLYAKYQNINRVDELNYSDSGYATGDQSSVVGYMSLAMFKENSQFVKESSGMQNKANSEIQPLNEKQKLKLIQIALQTINLFVKEGKTLSVQESDPRLLEEEGVFVTIHKNGLLRGCIGNILGKGPIYLTVRDMAIAAASQDPRFPPIKENELSDLDIEISVLSKPVQTKNIEDIKMGVHGVIVRKGWLNQGVFLPQVALETGWSKEEFLSQLCSQKAGLARDAWKDSNTILEIFTASVFSEKEFNNNKK